MKAGKKALKRKVKTVEGKMAGSEEGLADIPAVKRARKSKKEEAAGRLQPGVADDIREVSRDAKHKATSGEANGIADHKTDNSKRFRSKEKILLLTARGISSRWALVLPETLFPFNCPKERL